MSLTEQLARFAAETRIEDIPAVIMLGSRDALMDTLGAAMAGTREEVCGIAERFVRETGARPEVSVWGKNIATSPLEAAFANGISAHALDFDDSIPTLRGHPSATMLAAALAVGEATHASGAAVLASHAIGLEIAGKLGRMLGDDHYHRGWHTSATVGVFSSATVAARLWGLDALGMQTAWGLAASQMSGLVRNFGTMTKPFHLGQTARAGVLSAWLARAGFTADTQIFDGPHNMQQTYAGADGIDLELLLKKLAQPWEMIEPGIAVKRWPCCYGNHRPITGLLALRAEHHIQADEIDSIEVAFVEGNDAALISTHPQTGLEAKFSIEYVAAATMIDGRITLDSFTDEMVQRPALRALMAKVRRARIPAAETPPGSVFVKVAITTERGRFETRVENPPGSRLEPMNESDRYEKFMDCAQRVLSSEQALTLHALIDGCVKLDDISILVRATNP